jgi:hypothetical protein
MVPGSDRTLVSEEPVWQAPEDARRTFSDAGRTGKTGSLSPDEPGRREPRAQKSFRRLSDFVTSEKKAPTVGSKRDIWLVRFSDVVLRCQRVGVTTLPVGRFEKGSKDKEKSKGRNQRNLYRFVQVDRWETKHPKVVNGLSQPHSSAYLSPSTEGSVTEEDEEDEVLANGGQSRMRYELPAPCYIRLQNP